MAILGVGALKMAPCAAELMGGTATPPLSFERGDGRGQLRGMTSAEFFGVTRRVDQEHQPVPFEVRFVAVSLFKNKPAKHYHWKNAVRCGASHNLARAGQIAMKPKDGSHVQIAVNHVLIYECNGQPVA